MRQFFMFFCAMLSLGCVGWASISFANNFASTDVQVSLVIPPIVRIEEQSLAALNIEQEKNKIDITASVSLSSNLVEEFHVLATSDKEQSSHLINLTLEPI